MAQLYSHWNTPKVSSACTTETCSAISIAARLTIALKWKQLKSLTFYSGQMFNEIWSIYTMKCSSGAKKNEIINVAGK